MVKRLLFTLLLSTLAWGQGSRRDDAALGNNGTPVPFPTVRICTEIATGVPCSPLASISTDKTLTVASTNPFTGDAFGNFFFFAAPGWYQVQVSGAGVSPYSFLVLLPPDVANSTFNTLNVTGAFTITGTFNAAAFASTVATPAQSGFIRSAASDALCWRNTANTADVCLSKNGSDQIVGASSSTPIVSTTTNPAATGVIRLAAADTFCWRNAANSADICLSKNGSDQILGAVATSPLISGTANPAATGIVRLAKSDALAFRNDANTSDISITKNSDDSINIPIGLSIAGDVTMTHSPRMIWTAQNSTAYAGVASFGSFVTTQPIKLVRLDVWSSIIGVACSTQPVVDVSDGTNSYFPTTIANSSQLNSSTTGAPIAIAAGVQLRFRITTVAAGCSPSPSGPQWSVQYTMQ